MELSLSFKNSPSTTCRGSRPSWALVGARCSNRLQVAQGQDLVRDCVPDPMFEVERIISAMAGEVIEI